MIHEYKNILQAKGWTHGRACEVQGYGEARQLLNNIWGVRQAGEPVVRSRRGRCTRTAYLNQPPAPDGAKVNKTAVKTAVALPIKTLDVKLLRDYGLTNRWSQTSTLATDCLSRILLTQAARHPSSQGVKRLPPCPLVGSTLR